MAFVDEALLDRMLAAAEPYYREPFRSYHDWRHPLEMLSEARRLGIALTQAQALALVFHDIFLLIDPVYLHGNFNESVSAHLMRAHARHLGIADAVVEEAGLFVMSTDHAPREAVSLGCAEILDLDLLRLAQPYDRFVQHSLDVAFEWRHVVPDEGEFMSKRAVFLTRFAERPAIYYTEHFDEEAARANIERFAGEYGRS